MNRAIIVHGWEGYPEEGWFPWLGRELESRGFSVLVPAMPNPSNPRIQEWVPALARAVGSPDPGLVLIGHSIGCQAIVRYLTTLPAGARIAGAVFVGGWFKRLAIEDSDPAGQEMDAHWLKTPVDFAAAKERLGGSVAIFSDNDQWVPLDNQDDFRDKLGSLIVLEHKKRHFSGSDGVTELPSALGAVLRLASR